MADGYARVAGKPGLCWAQSVGAANLAAGPAGRVARPRAADRDHRPQAGVDQDRNAYQEIDHAKAFSAVTRHSGNITRAEDLPRLLANAWRTALAGVPRPVHSRRGRPDGRIPGAVVAGRCQRPRRSSEEHHSAGASRLGPSARKSGSGDPRRSQGGHRRRQRCSRGRRRPCHPGAGKPAGRAGGDNGGRSRPHSDDAPARHRHGRQLRHGRHQPRRARGRPGAGGGRATQRPEHARLAHPGRTHQAVVQIDADAAEAGRVYPHAVPVLGDPRLATRRLVPQLEHYRSDEGFARQAALAMQTWRSEVSCAAHQRRPSRSASSVCAPKSATCCLTTPSWWPTPATRRSGAHARRVQAGPDLPARGRFSGLVFSGGVGRQMRGARPQGGVLQRRRRLLLPHGRDRDGPALRPADHGGGEQQLRLRPGRVQHGGQGHADREVRDLAAFKPTDFAAIARSFGANGMRVTAPGQLQAPCGTR